MPVSGSRGEAISSPPFLTGGEEDFVRRNLGRQSSLLCTGIGVTAQEPKELI